MTGRGARAIIGICLLATLVSACGGSARSTSGPPTSRSTTTSASVALTAVAWPPQAVAALEKPWIEGCSASPSGGTSKGRCTTLFTCLRESFGVAEFERLSVGYFQGGALPTRDRARVVGCFSRAHIVPSG